MPETNLTVGEVLHRARLQYRLTLEQAEAGTRIKAIYLDALEKGDYDRLPGKVYVVGFVKSYSDYLGLDADEMVKLLKKQANIATPKPAQIFPVATEDQKVPSKKIVLISTGILVFILILWNISHPTGSSDSIPAVPKELAQQMTVPENPPEAAEAAVTATEEKSHPVVMKATQDVWLEIRDAKGAPVFSRVLKAGEEYWVPADQQGLVMTTGNSGGLQMIIEGTAMKPMGRIGEVKRNIALNPAALKVMLSPAE